MSRLPCKQQKIIIRDESIRSQAINLLSALDLAKPWEVTVGRYRKKRSLPQNALFWKWCEIIGDHTGYAKTEIADIYRDKFLAPEIRTFAGAEVEVRPSTTKLSTAEMSEYLERIYIHATSELGLLLPVPEELHQELS